MNQWMKQMEFGILGEYFKGPCFHSQDQFKAIWNESAQNILGKAQSPANWCRTFLLVHVQMGSRSITNCECGTTEQTADHVISLCLIHHVPRGTRGLQVLDDATQCWLNATTASI